MLTRYGEDISKWNEEAQRNKFCIVNDCPYCNTHHDRDINAAINILSEGLRIRVA